MKRTTLVLLTAVLIGWACLGSSGEILQGFSFGAMWLTCRCAAVRCSPPLVSTIEGPASLYRVPRGRNERSAGPW